MLPRRKTEKSKSNYINLRLYFYDYDIIEIAKTLKYGEKEISPINEEYLK